MLRDRVANSEKSHDGDPVSPPSGHQLAQAMTRCCWQLLIQLKKYQKVTPSPNGTLVTTQLTLQRGGKEGLAHIKVSSWALGPNGKSGGGHSSCAEGHVHEDGPHLMGGLPDTFLGQPGGHNLGWDSRSGTSSHGLLASVLPWNSGPLSTLAILQNTDPVGAAQDVRSSARELRITKTAPRPEVSGLNTNFQGTHFKELVSPYYVEVWHKC